MIIRPRRPLFHVPSVFWLVDLPSFRRRILMFGDNGKKKRGYKLLRDANSGELLTQYVKVKKTEAIVAVTAVVQSTASLVFISFVSILNQRGLFRSELKSKVWAFVEFAALLLVSTSLVLSAVSLAYISRKKARLRKLLENSDTKISDAEPLCAVEHCAESTSPIVNGSFVLEVLATSVLLVNQVLVVVDIFCPYGFQELHKSWGMPFSTPCLVDLVALAILLAASVLRVIAADEKRRKDLTTGSKKPQCKVGVFSYITLPLLSLCVGICSTVGKVLQGMESNAVIEIGKDSHGTFPLGFTIKAVCVALVICLGVYKAVSAVSEYIEVKTRFEMESGHVKHAIEKSDQAETLGVQSILD
ncbi:putative membrane protein [Neorickettsia sennetsu str. Miyayama]|uniref:Membrane protein n=1 Tax=Ehrlichia sennetsu (strain ATCC VR-367 / Miyayama) TaxID=222891 RepID=Q2GDJ2_EHRS3|nr:putative membrane protein [Neorickettsia sennetsu str. Miyayama]